MTYNVPFLSLAVNSGFSTTFTGTENPISESGAWVARGLAEGLDWTNPRMSGGFGWGTQTGNNGTDDSIAHLSGFTANQNSKVTLHVGTRSISFQEVEALVRFTITGHSATGYECLLGNGTDVNGKYAQIVRWNGSFNSFTLLATTNDTLTINDNSTWEAQIVGNTLWAKLDGTKINWTTNDGAAINGTDVDVEAFATRNGGSYWSTGQPGIGFYCQDSAQDQGYCATAYAATNV